MTAYSFVGCRLFSNSFLPCLDRTMVKIYCSNNDHYQSYCASCNQSNNQANIGSQRRKFVCCKNILLKHFIDTFEHHTIRKQVQTMSHTCIYFYRHVLCTTTSAYHEQPQRFSLQASLTPHAPPGGFSQTNIFGNLIHRPIEIRLSAKIPTLGEGVRALFPKWPPKYNI